MKRLIVLAVVAVTGAAFAETPGELFPKSAPAAPVAEAPASAPTRVIGGAVVTGNVQTLTRAPVPDEVKITDNRRDLEVSMRVDYSDKTAAGRKALANKLYAKAKTLTGVGPLRYVCYTEAAKFAAMAGEQELARTINEELSSLYAVDVETVQCQTFDAMAPQTVTPEDRRALSLAYASLVEPALAKDDYTNAMRYNTRARNMATAAGDAALAAVFQTRASDLKELTEEFPRVLAARKTLAESPEDPGANGVVGRFTALLKADFVAGLPQLAKSDQGMLKDLAARDLALASMEPKDAVRLIELGDAWRETAAKLTGLAHRNALVRARASYDRYLAESAKLAEQVKAMRAKVDAEIPSPAKMGKP